MDPGLLKSLGMFFDISAVVFCIPPDLLDSDLDVATERLSSSWNMSWKAAAVRHSEIAESPGTVMVLCERTILSGLSSTPELFRGNTVWVVPEEILPDSQVQELPLRLDSNLVSYSKIDNSTYEVKETYRINSVTSSVTKYNTLGTWSPNRGFHMESSAALWERRANLSGVTLINSVRHFDGLCSVEANGTVTGFMPDLLGLLQESLLFRFESFPVCVSVGAS